MTTDPDLPGKVAPHIDAVVIGRNEGERLTRCLASLEGLQPVIYVDSGSTDGSQEIASKAGADVVSLDLSIPFTAARARNAGLARLAEIASDTDFVQVLDGDTELREGWIDAASAAITEDLRLAIVCGRRRERHPEASRWNTLIDAEWDTPVGDAMECGGDALLRRAAIDEVGGYDPDLIAGEEPELCFRLRAAGWRIRRIEAEMTWHDAALTRFGQWWRRAERAGFSYAALARRHGSQGLRVAEKRRALIWGFALPLVSLLGAILVSSSALLLLLAWPLQVVRMQRRGLSWTEAVFLTLGKIPEAKGVLSEAFGHLSGRRRGLIEYK